MPSVCRNVDEVPRLHLDHSILKLEPGRSFQHHDPFMLILVVPEPFRRGVAVRNDPFDADLGGGEDRLHDFIGKLIREVMEEISLVLAALNLRRQTLKPRHFLPIDPHRFNEH